jgi:Tol biopolymer transport system component/tRNA A-37 threonylcarbamoyl transferase component Bud32
MSLRAGTRLGPYEIVSPIGAGGMGEVYRARDTKLHRDVAIKVVPELFADDADRFARFTREAHTLAALNHPNIAQIYGLEEQGRVRALVMELVDGDDLSQKIEGLRTKGLGLPLDEALPIAKQIAEALEYAHERAIIHRDLKPANIKLTPDGGVKVLDYGLAKALSDDPTGSGSDLSKSPTLTAASTRLGVILGTAAYMSPEQAKGKVVDRRADIWAFGSVLFEMLTGRQAFVGETVSETLASVMKDEADWNALPASTPARIRDLLRRCLVKDPKQRLRDIGDARIRIEEELSGSPELAGAASAASAAATVKRRGVPVLALALVTLVAVATGLAVGYTVHAPRRPPMFRATLTFPEGMTLDNDDVAFALSPDGRAIAIAAAAKGEPQRLWVRRLDSADATRLEGTDGASYPFWSPDGSALGFFADRKLKRVPAKGGVVQTICDAVDGRGATWGRGGTIVFAPGPLDGLNIVAADGGTSEAITTLDSVGTTHRLPCFLPDGKRVLFAVGRTILGSGVIECVDVTSKKRTAVMKGQSQACCVGDGYVAYMVDGNLVMQRFDPASLTVSGGAVPVAQGVQVNPYRLAGDFDVSSAGPFVYASKALTETNQPTWFDLDGRELGKLGGVAPINQAALSPNGRRLLTCDRTDRFDLWMTDVATGVRTRFTFGPDAAAFPIWSPDSKTVYYGDGVGNVLARASDGATPARKIVSMPGTSLWPNAVTPDGTAMVCFIQRPQSGIDLRILPLATGAEMRDLITAPGNQIGPSFSPDGRWLAYQTDESGRDEAVVVRFPSLEGRWQVSAQGGDSPAWLPDGRGILYETPDHHIARVDVDGRGEGLIIGSTTTIFGGKGVSAPWIIAPDGKRLLVLVPQGNNATMSLNLVTDWHPIFDARSGQ